MKQKPNSEELELVSERVLDSFYGSKELLTVVHDFIYENQPDPMSVAFAGILVDQMMRQSLGDEWKFLREKAIECYEAMRGEGIIGDFKVKDEGVRK